MREILFKGKRIDNGEWVFGSMVLLEDNGKFILPSNSKAYVPEGRSVICSCEFREIDPQTVCQYTGMNDEYGNKIFENDIIWISYSCRKEKDSVCQVVFQDGMFIGKMADGSEDSICAAEKVYVVGNISDHPELLHVQEPRKAFRQVL